MRTRIALALALATLPLSGCAFDEGLNVHDMAGTVYVPKSVAPTADDVGMIYVGLYSGVDNRLGYPSPIAAPAASTAGADTFPYGGTSIGNFMTRDARLICSTIGARSIRDEGTEWALDLEVLQFPFHEGTHVWAWMDVLVVGTAGINNYTSCDRDGGFYSYYQIEVSPIEVQAFNTEWLVVFDPDDLPLPGNVPGGNASRRYLDPSGEYWQVTEIDPGTNSIRVFDLYSNGGRPALSGPTDPLIISEADLLPYGSQFQDVLNFPGKYIAPGDFVVETPAVLEKVEDVDLTLAYEVQ